MRLGVRLRKGPQQKLCFWVGRREAQKRNTSWHSIIVLDHLVLYILVLLLRFACSAGIHQDWCPACP